jgi:DNA-binding GntR family transcriptional regulator
MLVSLELAPGSTIDEGSLQDSLNLGRTPIREALLRLSLEKLVNIIPRRGIFVSEISIPHLQQLFEMRLALEPLAARLAAQRGSQAQFQAMQAIIQTALAKFEQSQDEAFIETDKICHRMIYESAKNQHLEDTLNILYTLSLRLWYYSQVRVANLERALSQQLQIASALEIRDANTASELIEQHVSAFQDEIQSAMLGLAI